MASDALLSLYRKRLSLCPYNDHAKLSAFLWVSERRSLCREDKKRHQGRCHSSYCLNNDVVNSDQHLFFHILPSHSSLKGSIVLAFRRATRSVEDTFRSTMV